jgi:hypothetical protein
LLSAPVPDPGSAFVVGGQMMNDLHEAYVCPEHKEMIDAESLWDIHAGQVLIEQDMAPTLERWSSRESSGTVGFTLTLEAAGLTKPLKSF